MSCHKWVLETDRQPVTRWG